MPRRKKIKVLLCNKYELFREGVKALFQERRAIDIVGDAATARQTIVLLQRLHPDVVLLDASMADSSGSDATRRIKAIDPHVEILILSMDEDERLIHSCMDAGADGYIRRSDGTLHLKRAIRTAGRKGDRRVGRPRAMAASPLPEIARAFGSNAA